MNTRMIESPFCRLQKPSSAAKHQLQHDFDTCVATKVLPRKHRALAAAALALACTTPVFAATNSQTATTSQAASSAKLAGLPVDHVQLDALNSVAVHRSSDAPSSQQMRERLAGRLDMMDHEACTLQAKYREMMEIDNNLSQWLSQGPGTYSDANTQMLRVGHAWKTPGTIKVEFSGSGDQLNTKVTRESTDGTWTSEHTGKRSAGGQMTIAAETADHNATDTLEVSNSGYRWANDVKQGQKEYVTVRAAYSKDVAAPPALSGWDHPESHKAGDFDFHLSVYNHTDGLLVMQHSRSVLSGSTLMQTREMNIVGDLTNSAQTFSSEVYEAPEVAGAPPLGLLMVTTHDLTVMPEKGGLHRQEETKKYTVRADGSAQIHSESIDTPVHGDHDVTTKSDRSEPAQ